MEFALQYAGIDADQLFQVVAARARPPRDWRRGCRRRGRLENGLAGLIDGLREQSLVLQGLDQSLVIAQALDTKAQLVGEILENVDNVTVKGIGVDSSRPGRLPSTAFHMDRQSDARLKAVIVASPSQGVKLTSAPDR